LFGLTSNTLEVRSANAARPQRVRCSQTLPRACARGVGGVRFRGARQTLHSAAPFGPGVVRAGGPGSSAAASLQGPARPRLGGGQSPRTDGRMVTSTRWRPRAMRPIPDCLLLPPARRQSLRGCPEVTGLPVTRNHGPARDSETRDPDQGAGKNRLADVLNLAPLGSVVLHQQDLEDLEARHSRAGAHGVADLRPAPPPVSKWVGRVTQQQGRDPPGPALPDSRLRRSPGFSLPSSSSLQSRG
jgi:hypothetical protein